MQKRRQKLEVEIACLLWCIRNLDGRNESCMPGMVEMKM